MSDIDRSSANLTRRAIVAYQAGRPESARELLGEAIQADPANELAWLWMAALAHKNEEKRYCLDRALEINPAGAARDALAELVGVRPVVPTYVAAMDDLPLPKEITEEQGKQIRSSYQWRWLWLAGAGAALLAGFLVFVKPQLETPNDNFPQANTNRGNAYLRQGRIDLAIADFRQAGETPVDALLFSGAAWR